MTPTQVAREQDLRWANHLRVHELETANLTNARESHEREHFAHVSAHDREHVMTGVAITTATGALDKRLEGMNEFRGTLRDQQSTFLRREQYEAQAGAMLERVINLEKSNVKVEGRSLGQGTIVGLIVGAVTLVGTILGIIVVASNLLTN